MVDATAKSKLYIGTTAAADDLIGFEADTYTEIKDIEDLGEIGEEAAQLTFVPVGGRGVHKKGATTGKVVNLVVGRNPTDPGQQALRAAAQSHLDYNFKLTLNNAAPPSVPSTFYFRGLTFPAATALGNAEAMIKDTHPIAINSEIIELEPGNVPALPTSLVLTPTDITIDVAFTGAVGVTSHQARYRQGAGEWTTWATIVTGGDITGLAPDTEYEVQVRGVNASGHGPAASDTVTTEA